MKLVILAICLLAGGTAWADGQKFEIKDLPKPVLTAVKAKFPEAKITEAAKEEEDGKTIYEVTLKGDDKTIDLAVSAKGKILEVEREIAAEKLPDTVTAALAAKYPKAKIKKAEEVINYEDDEEKKTFEVVMAAPGKADVEVKLSPKGKILADGEENDDDDGAKDEKKAIKKKDKDDDKS